MSLPDTIFIFGLALVIFGPKKLPEIGRQIGKLVFEFRRASNEFKMQIEEELRAAEQAERQKKLAAESSQELAPAVIAKEAMIVRPPSTGEMVSTESPSSHSSSSWVVPIQEEAAALESVSSPNPVDAPADLPAAENGYHHFVEHPLESDSAPVPETTVDTIGDTAADDFELSQPAQLTLLPPEAAASTEIASGVAPLEDPAALPAAGSRQEAARSAEEHIREQIAIHHG
jgi:sec-independent protein translocase protein TatB